MAGWVGAIIEGIADFGTALQFFMERSSADAARKEAIELTNREISDQQNQFNIDMDIKRESLDQNQQSIDFSKRMAFEEKKDLAKQRTDIENELRGANLFGGIKRSFTGIPETLEHKQSVLRRF